jgi:glyoxylase-like metal-dependent hydrolase (beta-lactamase superfamily II)
LRPVRAFGDAAILSDGELSMNRWQIGNVKITRVVELEVAGGTKFILPDATPAACRDIEWLKPHFMTDEGKLIMSVHALVLDTGKRRVIVDTCIGNDKERSIPNWSHLQTSFLSDLAAAGYPRESIDTVLCTHLHVDHVGWNTMLVDGNWVPTFPNARYLIAEQEWKYWDSHEDESQYGSVLADSVRPVIEADLVDFVPMTHRLTDEIWFEPTPGHTAGHVSVHIESNGAEALITGDCIHHPCQIARTDWTSTADFDKAQGVRTRNELLAKYAESAVLVIGTHFATPTAGHIKRNSQGTYRFEV